MLKPTTSCPVYLLPVSGTHTLTPPTMHEVVWPARPSHAIIAQLNILASQTMHAWGVKGIARKEVCMYCNIAIPHVQMVNKCVVLDCNTNLVW